MDALLQNPAFQIIALIAALVIIILNVILAISILRGRKGNIEDAFNRDKQAMDELHKRVEELKK